MADGEIVFLTAVEMAQRIRCGALSARETMEAHLRQIERVNPRVNAIVTLDAEGAIRRARAADEMQAQGGELGPLHGLPVAHKDLLETAGMRTTFGSPLFREYVPTQDAIIVERARAAGAIAIGKTNTPEFGAGSQTFNRIFGATRNPWNLSKTAGGSSGGSAVALACGMTPLADGTDVGGSLRNPAAYCGVVGLRVAPGRVPEVARTNPWSTLNVCGPMGRTAGDVALLLSAIAGPDPRSPIALDEPGGRFRGDLSRDFKGVRVAWYRDLGGVPWDSRVRAAAAAHRRTFESLGCIVEEAEPDLSGADEAFNILRAWGFAANYSEVARGHREELKDTILWEVARGEKLRGADLARAALLRGLVWNRMRQFLEKYEYFILPTTQVPPFDVDLEFPREIEGVWMNSYIDWMKSCYLISILETPAISVPCGFTPEGLPVGLQIVGRHRGEWSILQLAHAFEQAAGVLAVPPPARNEESLNRTKPSGI
jgi:amidase